MKGERERGKDTTVGVSEWWPPPKRIRPLFEESDVPPPLCRTTLLGESNTFPFGGEKGRVVVPERGICVNSPPARGFPTNARGKILKKEGGADKTSFFPRKVYMEPHKGEKKVQKAPLTKRPKGKRWEKKNEKG